MNSLKRRILIEGILFFIIGIGCITEAIRLLRQKDPNTIYDVLGPWSFILFLGIALIITTSIHLAVEYRRKLSKGDEGITQEMRRRMIGVLVVFAIYTILIDIVGYAVASIFFFLLEFRIAGIKSWRSNAILSLVFTAAFYLVFVKLCDMVFPHRMFWG